MALDPCVVRQIADLAKIHINEAETDELCRELGSIIQWVAQLDEVDTNGVEPMDSVAFGSLPLRHDIVTDGNCAQDILANSSDAVDGFFSVPKVVE